MANSANSKGPRLVLLSGTGLTKAGRDIYFLMQPLYWLLTTPLAEKKTFVPILSGNLPMN